MAVINSNEKYSVKVEYKPEYDETGNSTLTAYSQTFTKVKETASPEALRNFAVALMSLTEYNGAPFKVTLIKTGDLIVE